MLTDMSLNVCAQHSDSTSDDTEREFTVTKVVNMLLM